MHLLVIVLVAFLAVSGYYIYTLNSKNAELSIESQTKYRPYIQEVIADYREKHSDEEVIFSMYDGKNYDSFNIRHIKKDNNATSTETTFTFDSWNEFAAFLIGETNE